MAEIDVTEYINTTFNISVYDLVRAIEDDRETLEVVGECLDYLGGDDLLDYEKKLNQMNWFYKYEDEESMPPSDLTNEYVKLSDSDLDEEAHY